MTTHQKATFAAGCFWGVEHEFRKLKGVVEVISGYTGGKTGNPGYEQVCTGETGHAEAVQITFDPSQITYLQLLDHFWAIHNPTQLNRQGPDVGTQYRSSIFFHSKQQKEEAEDSLAIQQGKMSKLIVTSILPAAIFYPAEEYHQRYFEKHPEKAQFCPHHAYMMQHKAQSA